MPAFIQILLEDADMNGPDRGSEICLFYSFGYKRHMHKQDDACFPDWMRDISDFILCCYHNIQNALTSTQTKTEYK